MQLDVELLGQLKELGILPGAKVTVDFEGTSVLIAKHGSADGLRLEPDLAMHLFVEA
jgi:DtxR family Mn-dependent transcriptional regulator